MSTCKITQSLKNLKKKTSAVRAQENKERMKKERDRKHQ